MVSYEVYVDQCIFNCIVTNNRKEDIVISGAMMKDVREVELDTELEYTIAPAESKKISISIDSKLFVPTMFELTRETKESYMNYTFTL